MTKNEININYFKEIDNKNIIINYYEFNNNQNNLYNSIKNNFNTYNNEKEKNLYQIFEKNILKIFISIFLYEKSLCNNEQIFTNKKFFLINPNWYKIFKEKYNYSSIFQTLNTYYKNNNNDQNIENILGIFSKTNIFKFEKIENYEEISNIDNIKAHNKTKENIVFCDDFFIIPYNIITMISKTFFNNNIVFNLNDVFSKNTYIFVINCNTINVGIFKKGQLLFTSNFVFDYNNKNILDDEMKKLLSSSIKNYIESRQCDTSIYNEIQIMKNEQLKNVGKLLILKNKPNEQDNNQNNIPSYANKFIKKSIIQSQKRCSSTGRELSNYNYDKFIQDENKKNRKASLDGNYINNGKTEKNENINLKDGCDNNVGINSKNKFNENKKDISNQNAIEANDENINNLIKENYALKEKIQKREREIKVLKKEKDEIKKKYYNEKNNNQNLLNNKEKELKIDYQNLLKEKEKEINNNYQNLLNGKEKELKIYYQNLLNNKENENELKNQEYINKLNEENKELKNKINQLENIIKEKDIEINNISNNNKNKNEKNDEEINNIKETNKKLNEEINKKNKELEYIKELIEKNRI